MCGRRDHARVNPNPTRGVTAGRMRFGGILLMPIVLGASVVGLIAQDKKNAMGAALLYGGTARLTADDSLLFCSSADWRDGRGAARAGFPPPHKRTRGSTLSVP